MIIRMEENASFKKIEAVIKKFQKMGGDVLVKNGKSSPNILIAVFGLGTPDCEVRRIPGIKTIQKSNGLFIRQNGKGFVEAWEYFQRKQA